MQVRSLAWHAGLRIQCCHSSSIGQLWLGSDLWLRNPICLGVAKRREKEEREIRQNEERERRQNNNNNHRHNKPPLDSESIRLARLRNIDRYGVLNQINDRRDDNRQNPIEEEDIINLLLLPVTEIKDNDHKPKGNCIICLGDFYPKEKVTSLPCLHIFHHKCIQVWLKIHKVCPVCKLKLNGHGLGTE